MFHISEQSDWSCDSKKHKKHDKLGKNRNGYLNVGESIFVAKYFDIETINRVMFENLNISASSLEAVEITSTSSSHIEDDSFMDLKNLKRLILNNNFLEKIGKNTFSSLTNLQTLDLSSNLLSIIDSEAFSALENLFFLYLHDNCIKAMDKFHFASNEFQKIHLSMNLITALPHMENVNRIHELDLSSNKIEILNFRKYFTVLHSLKVSRNKISSVIADNQTPIVHSINSLYMSQNNITNTFQLAEFINLIQLDLSQNPIDYQMNIDFLNRHKKLAALNLTDTNLTDFRAVQNLNDFLSELSIAKNPLKIDFKVLTKYRNLKTIEFQQDTCYYFDNYKTISEQFPKLENVKLTYDNPQCKCLRKQKGIFRLYMIKFQTDWHHCSDANILNGYMYLVIFAGIFNFIVNL